MDKRIPELRKQLESELSPGRYEHSLSVSFLCVALAMRYGYDIRKAELAGLLHDCAKQYSNTVLIEKCRQQQIDLSEAEALAGATIHAKYGAWMAKEIYGVSDESVLSAIHSHTTGKPKMTLLEKIVFTADYIEPRRNQAPNLDTIRYLAFQDLDQAVYEILRGTLAYLQQQGKITDPMTQKAFDYYKERRSTHEYIKRDDEIGN